jgi:hypothetical protein
MPGKSGKKSHFWPIGREKSPELNSQASASDKLPAAIARINLMHQI